MSSRAVPHFTHLMRHGGAFGPDIISSERQRRKRSIEELVIEAEILERERRRVRADIPGGCIGVVAQQAEAATRSTCRPGFVALDAATLAVETSQSRLGVASATRWLAAAAATRRDCRAGFINGRRGRALGARFVNGRRGGALGAGRALPLGDLAFHCGQ